jgi:hypothetical protein
VKYLAEGIKDGVEIDKNFALGDLGDVVQAFCGEVSYPVLWVGEAREDGFDELVHVWGNVDAEGDGSSGETNQTTVSDVKWVGRITEHVHELFDDLADTTVVALLVTFANLPAQWCLSA